MELALILLFSQVALVVRLLLNCLLPAFCLLALRFGFLTRGIRLVSIFLAVLLLIMLNDFTLLSLLDHVSEGDNDLDDVNEDANEQPHQFILPSVSERRDDAIGIDLDPVHATISPEHDDLDIHEDASLLVEKVQVELQDECRQVEPVAGVFKNLLIKGFSPKDVIQFAVGAGDLDLFAVAGLTNIQSLQLNVGLADVLESNSLEVTHIPVLVINRSSASRRMLDVSCCVSCVTCGFN